MCGHKSSPNIPRTTAHQRKLSRTLVQDAEALCTEGTIPCRPTGPCLGISQLCDGLVDCPGGEDETLTVCALIKKETTVLETIPTTENSLNPKELTRVTNSYKYKQTSVPLSFNTDSNTTKKYITVPKHTNFATGDPQTTIKSNTTFASQHTDTSRKLEETFMEQHTFDDKKSSKTSTIPQSDIPVTTSSTTEYVTDDYNYEYNFGFDEYDYLHYNHIDQKRTTKTTTSTIAMPNISTTIPPNHNGTMKINNGFPIANYSNELNFHSLEADVADEEEDEIATPEYVGDKPMADVASSKFNQGIYEVTSPKVQIINCGDEEFDCGGGWCVPSFWLCDGHFDCHEGEDEDPILCNPQTTVLSSTSSTTESPTSARTLGPTTESKTETTTVPACSPEEWRCPTGHCIPQEFFCDGVLDCPEGYDEVSGCSFSDIIDYEDYPPEYDNEYNFNEVSTSSSRSTTKRTPVLAEPTSHPNEITNVENPNSFDLSGKNTVSTVHHALIPKLVTSRVPEDKIADQINSVTKNYPPNETDPVTSGQNNIKHKNDLSKTYDKLNTRDSAAPTTSNVVRNKFIPGEVENSSPRNYVKQDSSILRDPSHRTTNIESYENENELEEVIKQYKSALNFSNNRVSESTTDASVNGYDITTISVVGNKTELSSNNARINIEEHREENNFQVRNKSEILRNEQSISRFNVTSSKKNIANSTIITIEQDPHQKYSSNRINNNQKKKDQINNLNYSNITNSKNSPEVRISLLPPSVNVTKNITLKNARIIDIPIKTNGYLQGISTIAKSITTPSQTQDNTHFESSHQSSVRPPFFQTSISSSFSSLNPTVTIAASTTKDGQVVFTTHFSGVQINPGADHHVPQSLKIDEMKTFPDHTTVTNSQPINTQINMNSYFYSSINSAPANADNKYSSTDVKINKDSQNCTILIAINGGSNDGKIPEYIIHGKNGEAFEYKVVSVIDQPLDGNRITDHSVVNSSVIGNLQAHLMTSNKNFNASNLSPEKEISNILNNSSDTETKGNVSPFTEEIFNSFKSPVATLEGNDTIVDEIVIVPKNWSKDQDEIYDNEYYIGNKEMSAYQYDVFREDSNGTNIKVNSQMYSDQERTDGTDLHKTVTESQEKDIPTSTNQLLGITLRNVEVESTLESFSNSPTMSGLIKGTNPNDVGEFETVAHTSNITYKSFPSEFNVTNFAFHEEIDASSVPTKTESLRGSGTFSAIENLMQSTSQGKISRYTKSTLDDLINSSTLTQNGFLIKENTNRNGHSTDSDGSRPLLNITRNKSSVLYLPAKNGNDSSHELTQSLTLVSYLPATNDSSTDMISTFLEKEDLSPVRTSIPVSVGESVQNVTEIVNIQMEKTNSHYNTDKSSSYYNSEILPTKDLQFQEKEDFLQNKLIYLNSEEFNESNVTNSNNSENVNSLANSNDSSIDTANSIDTDSSIGTDRSTDTDVRGEETYIDVMEYMPGQQEYLRAPDPSFAECPVGSKSIISFIFAASQLLFFIFYKLL